MTHNETTSHGGPPPGRQRIAKLMARVGLCSRREAETWVVAGRVSVNGTVLTSPAVDVGPDDRILVDGAPLPKVEPTRLFLFHKPRGLVTSDHDPEGRATVADFLRGHWPETPRVVTVGRLDINTEGLLLLTNDGGLARVVELPKTGWARRYRVRAKGETDQGTLDTLRDGVTVDGMDYAGIEATLDRTQGANVWLTMGLREGKNREVKRVLESIGLEVNRLIRLSFGPFQLGDLAEGAVEEVRPRVLRDQLGLALAAAAGVVFADAAPKTERGSRTSGGERSEKSPREGRRPLPRDSNRPARRDERGGDRPHRRPHDEAPPPRRERPGPAMRKHVSTLRAAETDAAQHGPRRRIERSDVTDRKERAVRVERLVGARPATSEPRRPRGPREESGRDDGRRSDTGRGHPDGRRAPKRQHASPSAIDKRTHIAKSGSGAVETRRDRPASDRHRRTTETRSMGGPKPHGHASESHRLERGKRHKTPPAGRPSDPKRQHASPSALAKRTRIAKSGGSVERKRTEGPASDRRGKSTETGLIERTARRAAARFDPKRAKTQDDRRGSTDRADADAGRKPRRPERAGTRDDSHNDGVPRGKPHSGGRPPRRPAPRPKR